MTFTRSTDSATLTPLIVFGPYENSYEVRNIARPLLQSSSVRVTYVPQGPRDGKLMLLFASYANAVAAAGYFAPAASFTFNGPVVTTTGYTIVNNVVLPVGDIDDTFDMTFIVTGGTVDIEQNELWEVSVPFKELL